MRQTGGKTKTQVARRSPILRWRTPPTLLSLSLPKCAPTWNQRQLSFLFYLFDRPLSTAAFGTIDETLFGTNQSTQRREIGQRGFRPVGSKKKGDRERESRASFSIDRPCLLLLHYPEHGSEIRIPETEGDVGDMEPFGHLLGRSGTANASGAASRPSRYCHD